MPQINHCMNELLLKFCSLIMAQNYVKHSFSKEVRGKRVYQEP